MTKCVNCKEVIHIGGGTFSGIPKKKFCTQCWNRIDTLWRGMQYSQEDPKLLDWTLKIKIPNE